MKKIDWNKVTLKWYGKPPAIENYESIVREDCALSLTSLDKVSDLTFHTIFLSNNYEYDIITVWGEEGSEILYCEYEPKPTWISLKDWEKNRKS